MKEDFLLFWIAAEKKQNSNNKYKKNSFFLLEKIVLFIDFLLGVIALGKSF